MLCQILASRASSSFHGLHLAVVARSCCKIEEKLQATYKSIAAARHDSDGSGSRSLTLVTHPNIASQAGNSGLNSEGMVRPGLGWTASDISTHHSSSSRCPSSARPVPVRGTASTTTSSSSTCMPGPESRSLSLSQLVVVVLEVVAGHCTRLCLRLSCY